MKKKFGLIGKKLSHSYSKSFFEKKFKDLELDCVYDNFELAKIEEVESIFRFNDLVGLNVTTPYKEAVIPFLTRLDETARAVGAVNCIHIKNGKKIGYNTDVFGFRQMIKPFLESHHERALVLGKGGAAKAVVHVLQELGVSVFVITRNPKSDIDFSYEEVNANMMRFCQVIVNTTPLGMFPNIDAAPDIPYDYFSPKHLAVDLIYNPAETLFMQKAKAHGASVINGQTMLHQQAEKSWEIWNS